VLLFKGRHLQAALWKRSWLNHWSWCRSLLRFGFDHHARAGLLARYYVFWRSLLNASLHLLRLNNDSFVGQWLSTPLRLLNTSWSHRCRHLLLFPQLLLLLSEPLVFAFVEEGSSQLLSTTLYLLHKVELTHLVYQLLVLFLLRCNFLFLKLLLPLLLFRLSGSPLILFNRLYE